MFKGWQSEIPFRKNPWGQSLLVCTPCWAWNGLQNSHPTSDSLSFLCLPFKLGIRDFTEQDVGSHQSYSRKTLIALVTSGILLAVLGTTGYFLMNRRSWSPTGERLVSLGVQSKEIEEDRGLLGRSLGVMRREEKYQKRCFCALTR